MADEGWSVDELFSDTQFVAQLRRLLYVQSGRFLEPKESRQDLVNAAVQGLWQYAKRRPELFSDLQPSQPDSWTGPPWDTVARLSQSMLKRRAADLYRQNAARWARKQLSASRNESESASEQPSPARLHLLRQMLTVCTAELAQVTDADRDALWEAMDRGGNLRPMSDVARQRASRLRRRLALAIQEQLGESVITLLAADLQDKESGGPT